jgi:DNA (cytosine-5)-methyltransferase 1
MRVLSLFDGMSCGQQALDRIGLKVDTYFASEIDKYAIQVTMANYPNTIQLGSVVDVNGYDLPKIDLLIGGSPCQSFSFAGKRKGMSTKDEQEILTLEHYLQLKSEGYEFEGQSYLFWEYMRLLHEVKPKYFLLENVMMGEKWEKVLSKSIGVNAIEINSSLVSAQNRRRLYWTNIGMESGGLFGDLESIIQQPKDKNILLKHILESNVDEKYFLSDKMISWLDRHSIKMGIEIKKLNENQKSSCLTSSAQTKQNLSTDYIIQNREVRQLNPSLESGGVQPYQQNRVYDADGISPALCAFKSDLNIKLNNQIRRLTPVECERLQTVKDNYTNHVSDSQRYRMLGNGWTVDVIAHIFGYIK